MEKLTDTDYYSYADTEELGRRHADMLCAGGEPGEDACQVAADTGHGTRVSTDCCRGTAAARCWCGTRAPPTA